MELADLTRQRIEKMEKLRSLGIDPYPPRSQRTHTAAQALALFTSKKEEEPAQVTVGGRLVSVREMGRATFAHLADGTGRLQIYLRQDKLGPESYELFKSFDIGVFVEVKGALFRTRTGEVTVLVESHRILAKSLHPLPEKWHGLTDVELRYRQRYLDLVANEEVRRIFVVRSKVVTAMRQFLDARGFLEVETPVLQPIYGGAAARPFLTHHNTLDRDLYLRIATELYLKRLIVGGFEKVYEIGKDFRNEGIDTKHNPEFTMMESYEAYADYQQVMLMVEEMISSIAQEVLGSMKVRYAGDEIDLTPRWRRVPMAQAIVEETGVDIARSTTLDGLRASIEEKGLAVAPKASWAKQVDELFSTCVQPRLVQPTFVMDHPVELSPLAKRKADNPGLAERFEPIIAGLELGNAFTELNDPLDQLERFRAQAQLRESGEEEAQPMDEDFVTALMVGMPPTGGLGIGIDRLVMLLTDQQSIREVILFPQLRTKD
jgi:lysyl-tRNA synthetase class 2